MRLCKQFEKEVGISENYDPNGTRISGYHSDEYKDRYIDWLEYRNREWISIKENLPETGAEVLIGIEGYVFFGDYNGTEFINCATELPIDAEYWQYRPEPAPIIYAEPEGGKQ